MMENHWQLQDAKNKFSSLVEQAQHNCPQIVTKHGKEAVVILSINEYKNLLKPKGSIVTFFQKSPLAQHDIDLERNTDYPRDTRL
jgi:prevent-host-death family protein